MSFTNYMAAWMGAFCTVVILFDKALRPAVIEATIMGFAVTGTLWLLSARRSSSEGK